MSIKRLRLLTLSFVHGTVHAVVIIYPVVLNAVRAEFGWSLSFAGWVGTAGFALFGITSLPTGWLADVVSRKLLLLSMLLAIVGGALLMGFSVHPLMFVLGWLLAGFAGGMHHPLALAVIAGSFQGKQSKALAWHGSGGNFMIAVTPALAGAVASLYSWRAAFLMGAGFAALALFLLLFIPESPAQARINRKKGKLPPWEQLWVLLLAHSITGFIYRGVVTYIPHSIGEVWEGMDLAAVGGVTTFVLIFGIAGQFLGGYLGDGKRFWPLYLGQVVLYSVSLLLLPLLSHWFFAAGLIFWSIVYYSTQPVVNSFLAEFGGVSSHGRLYGVAFFTNYTIGSLGAGMAGVLADYVGLLGMFWGLAAVALVAVVVLYFNRYRLNK